MRKERAKQVHGEPELGNTRGRINAVARDLYVLRGYNGFSFADVAKAVGTTRANIHHHYQNKLTLMNQLVGAFVSDAERRIAAHWTEGDIAFEERIRRQVADLEAFYTRYNPRPGDRNVWSPLSRLRLDFPVLAGLAADALERTDRIYDVAVTSAVRQAMAAGELAQDTPVSQVARLIRVTVLTSPPMTLDTGSFDELGRLFDALGNAVLTAWGKPGKSRRRKIGR